MEKRKIIRYSNGTIQNTEDTVVSETQVNLFVDHAHVFTFVTYPLKIKELIFGYLKTEGFIHDISDIQDYSFQIPTVHVTLKKDSKIAKKINQPLSYQVHTLISKQILEVMQMFQNNSILFKKTGAVHAAALANKDGIIKQFGDIGRFNAADKIIGYALKHNMDLEKMWFLFTGRIFQKLVEKITTTKLSAIISLSAVTSQAIDLAEEKGINLIGFVKKNKFNVYTRLNQVEII